MDPRQRRVRHQVLSFGSRLKNTLTDVFEDPAIFAFRSQARFFLFKQFLVMGLILRKLSRFFCSVGRRLRSSPLSHTSNLQELKIQLRERGQSRSETRLGGSDFCAKLCLRVAWEHGAIVPNQALSCTKCWRGF